jgi:hypothetical protein
LATPVDALGAVRMLAPKQERIFSAPSAGGAALRGGGDAFVEGRPAVRGRAIIPALEARGVTLHLRSGRLLVTVFASFDADGLEVVRIAERLLLGFLNGSPPCELRHEDKPPEAWTVLLGGILACEGHASGELAS